MTMVQLNKMLNFHSLSNQSVNALMQNCLSHVSIRQHAGGKLYRLQYCITPVCVRRTIVRRCSLFYDVQNSWNCLHSFRKVR